MADDRSAHETGSPPTGHRALRPLVALFLALTAVLLIALSYRPTPSRPPDETPVFLRSLPSPTWAPMPTRASVVRTSEPLDLIPLHQALLRGDVEEAERLWRAYADETLASDAAAMARGWLCRRGTLGKRRNAYGARSASRLKMLRRGHWLASSFGVLASRTWHCKLSRSPRLWIPHWLR